LFVVVGVLRVVVDLVVVVVVEFGTVFPYQYAKSITPGLGVAGVVMGVAGVVMLLVVTVSS
jgi:hypothetical protein